MKIAQFSQVGNSSTAINQADSIHLATPTPPAATHRPQKNYIVLVAGIYVHFFSSCADLRADFFPLFAAFCGANALAWGQVGKKTSTIQHPGPCVGVIIIILNIMRKLQNFAAPKKVEGARTWPKKKKMNSVCDIT